jgi:hypothetical protein
VIAGIENGRLPDTIVDRSIIISLERKLKSEPVARLRERDVASQAQEMRDRLQDWALLAGDRLTEYHVDTIPEISDRAEDIWEPLLAIAEDAGGNWPARAHAAAIRLSGEAAGDEDDVLLLLRRLRDMFDATGTLTSKEIVTTLNADADLPFQDYRKGVGINAHGLARMLAPYGVGPLQMRVGQDRIRGYKREQFDRVWARYLSDDETPPATPAQVSGTNGTSVTNPGGTGENGVTDLARVTDQSVTRDGSVTDQSVTAPKSVTAKSPANTGNVTGVTDVPHPSGPDVREDDTDGWGR